MLAALLPGTIRARAWVTLPLCIIAIALGAAAFYGIEHDGPGMSILSLAAIGLVLLMRALQPRWSFLGAQVFVCVTIASLAYLVYASLQTFIAGLPAYAVVASVVLH